MNTGSKKELPAKFSLSLLDITVLLYHVNRGAQLKHVGFEDADRSLKEMNELLTANFAKIPISQGALESALWSCNIMDEQRLFWSPQGKSFRKWLKHLCDTKQFDFDFFFNTITKRKGVNL